MRMGTKVKAGLVALGLMSAGAAQAQSSMTLMAYAGIFRTNYTDVVVNPFAGASGNQVQYFEGGTSAQMLGTLRAQKADPQIDVVIMDITTAALACAEGLVEKLTPADMPALNGLDQMARDSGNGCGPAVTYDHLVMIYDTKNVPSAPASYASLAEPAARGRVGLSAPPNIQGLAMTAAIAHSASGDWKNVASAMDLLKRIAPNVQTFDPNPDGYTLILNDQLRYATGWNARAQLYHDQSQGRIGVVIPREGTAFQINTINIVAGAKNRAAARAFMAHALGEQAQAAFTDRMFYGPTNVAAQASAKAVGRTALAPQYRDKVIPLDWNEMLRVRENWNQRWRREVIAAASR